MSTTGVRAPLTTQSGKLSAPSFQIGYLMYETYSAGVPHVVLPVWADTYDYAPRVEFLGIGRWGSRKASPKCRADELGRVLNDVILGPEADNMKKTAQNLAEVCDARGEGRKIAATEILRLLTTPNTAE